MEKKRATIFILEDEPLHVSMYRDKLTRAGFTVLTAGDEAETHKVLADHTPDLMVLDIYLPGKWGTDILEELRADSRFAKIPVVFLTNLESPQIRERAMKLGAREFLIKTSVTPQQVVEKLEKVLQETYA